MINPEIHINPPVESNKPKFYIILGEQFSGAGFVSQILNQREDTLFVYEPLGLYGQSCERDLDLKIHNLNQIAHCNIQKQSDIVAHHLK